MSNSIDLTKFKELLPADLLSFISLLNQWGFGLTLVGGAVRDFALYGELSDDLDFEIRSFKNIKDNEWVEQLRNLSTKIKDIQNIEIEVLKFNIFRIKLSSVELEISSPRIEIYDSSQNEFGHSDFQVKFSNNYSYKESFSRRDFTINAMGISFNPDESLTFIDPYLGLESIHVRELNYLTDDFFKDPVRFLRTLRFKVAHNLSLSRKLKDNIVYFNLKKLSLHYFIQEGKKIGIEKLVCEMDFSRRKFAIELPEWASNFKKMNASSYHRCNDLLDLILNYSIEEHSTDDDLLYLGKLFSVKESRVKKVLGFRVFKKFDFKLFKQNISNLDFQEASANEEFLRVYKLYKGIEGTEERIVTFFLHQEDLRILNRPIVKDDIYMKIFPSVKREQISMLGIYCHILQNY